MKNQNIPIELSSWVYPTMYLDEQKVLKKLRLLLEHPMLNQLSYESVFKTNSIHNVLQSWRKKFDQS